MKKTAWYCGALVLAVLNAVYLALTADSFYLEYVKDEFVYWGYPQWGWMYSDPKIYLWFNVLYLAFLLLLFAAGLFLIGKKRLKTGTALLLLPLLTAAAFLYMPTYNWNRQFAVFNAERTNENSRIPEGKWWVSLDQMQRYYDASLWERTFRPRRMARRVCRVGRLPDLAAARFFDRYARTPGNGFSRRNQKQFAVGN